VAKVKVAIRIIDLFGADEALLRQAAQLLVEGFRVHWPEAWPDFESALEEVHEALKPGKICRGAVDESGMLAGWIGGQPEYDDNVWELHPMVVRADMRGLGFGGELVADLEDRVRERGGLTVMLGTDDEDGMTSLSGVDLYDNLPEKIATIRNLKGHPFEFYQKVGYTVVGVVPDANGPGKPDIIMAKRMHHP
jgi:aminoglycoside 6'-N-acetyltransferase I